MKLGIRRIRDLNRDGEREERRGERKKRVILGTRDFCVLVGVWCFLG